MRQFISRFLAALAIASAALVLVPTKAISQQQQPPGSPVTAAAPTANGEELQTVTVTGYILPRMGDGPQPVTNYDRDFIDKTGSQTTTDFLQMLPAAVGNFAPNTTPGVSFSPASASIGLKGFPPNDTLVLVDGLRFPSFPLPQETTAGAISFVDLNSIPLAAVDRIEILNDGGSATYGTDAVAGVVNIILKDEYQGADIFNYFGISSRGDDETYHGSVVGGISHKLSDTSKFSIVAGIDYYSSGPIMQQDRPMTRLDPTVFSPNYPSHANFVPYAGVFTGPDGTVFQVNKGSQQPITAANFTVNETTQDFNDQFYQLQPRESRLGGFVKLNYQATDWLKFYDSILIQRNEELSSFQNQGVYPPAPFNKGGLTVPANNPFNPFGVPLLDQGQSLGEFGPFQADTTITTVRNVVGATVQLPDSWFVDTNFVYGESDATETVDNNFTVSGLQAALNGTLPGHLGQFFDPFADESLHNGPNKVFYGNKQLLAQIWQDNRTDLVSYNLRTGGPIAHLPNGDLTVAGGFEYRSESFIQNEDDNSKFGNVADYQETVGKLTNGRRYLKSLYGELDMPLLGNQWSWPGLRLLDAVFSYRWDSYSDFGNAEKPKIALRYKPFNDLTIRATYSEGFVAPSLSQLFGAPLPGQVQVIDPNNSQLGQQTVINSTVGNPNVKPEETYGYYVGAVWSPGSSDPDNSWWKWANGFSAYVNWFQIDQHNVVGTLSPQQIINLGPNAPPGNFVLRNSQGEITDITNTYLNLGNLRTDGIEVGFTYTTKEYDWGKLDLELSASYLYYESSKIITGLTPGGSLQYTVENVTDSFPTPDFKLLANAFYTKKIGLDTFRTGLTMHYTDSEADINNSAHGTDPNFQSDVPGTSYVHLIGSWTTFDWQISYEFGAPVALSPETPRPGYDKDGKRVVGEKAISAKPEGSSWGLRSLLANTTLTFGINNLFDTNPPFSSDSIQAYDPGSANFIGRFFFVSIEKKF
jgi:iron complex outermembrane recepter protein